jgi:hypothetical protein
MRLASASVGPSKSFNETQKVDIDSYAVDRFDRLSNPSPPELPQSRGSGN